MSNRPLKEMQGALPLSQAAKLIPGRPSQDTLRRWIHKGIRGGVKLDAFRVGGAIFTTEKAIEEFLMAQNTDPIKPRQHREAAEKLESMGV